MYLVEAIISISITEVEASCIVGVAYMVGVACIVALEVVNLTIAMVESMEVVEVKELYTIASLAKQEWGKEAYYYRISFGTSLASCLPFSTTETIPFFSLTFLV